VRAFVPLGATAGAGFTADEHRTEDSTPARRDRGGANHSRLSSSKAIERRNGVSCFRRLG
jgi:hypothetical protein